MQNSAPLLAQISNYSTIVTPTLDGITIILTAFWFYCLAKPERVRKKQQFWLVFIALMLIVVLYTLRLLAYSSVSGQIIIGIAIGLLHLGAMVLTVMYVGGLDGRDIADEVSDAAHGFQHGGDPLKPKIVPIMGKMPNRPEPVRKKDDDGEPRPRIVIDLPKTERDDKSGPLPLE